MWFSVTDDHCNRESILLVNGNCINNLMILFPLLTYLLTLIIFGEILYRLIEREKEFKIGPENLFCYKLDLFMY